MWFSFSIHVCVFTPHRQKSLLPLWHSFLTPSPPHPPYLNLSPPHSPLLRLHLSPGHNSTIVASCLPVPLPPLGPHPSLNSQHHRYLQSLRLSHHPPSSSLTPLRTLPRTALFLTLPVVPVCVVQSHPAPSQSRLFPLPPRLPLKLSLLPSPLHALPPLSLLSPIQDVGLPRWR